MWVDFNLPIILDGTHHQLRKVRRNRRRWADPEYRARVTKNMTNSDKRKDITIDGVRYKSQSDAARKLGVTRQSICWMSKNSSRVS